MESFGKALKNARKVRKATLREVGQAVDRSIGYISDIEHDRKRPPELNVVERMERFLNVEDGHLVELARKIRNSVASNIRLPRNTNPTLANVLYRAEQLPKPRRDDVYKKFLKTLEQYEDEED